VKSKYPYCFKAAMSKEKASCLGGGAKALKRQTEQEREREREAERERDHKM